MQACDPLMGQAPSMTFSLIIGGHQLDLPCVTASSPKAEVAAASPRRPRPRMQLGVEVFDKRPSMRNTAAGRRRLPAPSRQVPTPLPESVLKPGVHSSSSSTSLPVHSALDLAFGVRFSLSGCRCSRRLLRSTARFWNTVAVAVLGMDVVHIRSLIDMCPTRSIRAKDEGVVRRRLTATGRSTRSRNSPSDVERRNGTRGSRSRRPC